MGKPVGVGDRVGVSLGVGVSVIVGDWVRRSVLVTVEVGLGVAEIKVGDGRSVFRGVSVAFGYTFG